MPRHPDDDVIRRGREVAQLEDTNTDPVVAARRAAIVARGQAEQAISDAVAACREAGMTWKTIGAELGVSTQAVHQKYRPRTRPQD